MANHAFQGALGSESVKKAVASYGQQFDENDPTSRKANASELTSTYYDLVTDFYEFGWGESFHFAARHAGESLAASIIRHEHALATRLGLKAGQQVLDVGCGVGGPMRNIARLTGASVTGLNINRYQVERATRHNQKAGLAALCQVAEGDFLKMPFEAARFDAAYTIEACCHAGDRRGPFAETYRVLKPGALFAGYEWCVTDRYDAANPEHQRIKLGIEKGNGLPNLVHTSEISQSLRDVGFQVLETKDLVDSGHASTPWHLPLKAGATLQGFRNSKAGAFLTHQLVRVLETLKVSPKGTVEAHDVLRLAQRALVEGGELAIFTPMYFFLAQKP